MFTATFEDKLRSIEGYIRAKSYSQSIQDLMLTPDDLQQELRIYLFKNFKYWQQGTWKGTWKMWAKLNIRHRIWQLREKQKGKELIENRGGFWTRRITTISQIDEAGDSEDSDSAFNNCFGEDKLNKKFLAQIEIKRALANIRLTERAKTIFFLNVYGFSAPEIGEQMGLNESTVRNSVWETRFKLKSFLEAPIRKLDPTKMSYKKYLKGIKKRNKEIQKYHQENPKKSLSEIGFKFGLGKSRIFGLLKSAS